MRFTNYAPRSGAQSLWREGLGCWARKALFSASSQQRKDALAGLCEDETFLYTKTTKTLHSAVTFSNSKRHTETHTQ